MDIMSACPPGFCHFISKVVFHTHDGDQNHFLKSRRFPFSIKEDTPSNQCKFIHIFFYQGNSLVPMCVKSSLHYGKIRKLVENIKKMTKTLPSMIFNSIWILKLKNIRQFIMLQYCNCVNNRFNTFLYLLSVIIGVSQIKHISRQGWLIGYADY